MKITRDVINDLLPLYLTGEASKDTITLVEQFLEEGPEYASMICDQQPVLPEIEKPLSKENEMIALTHTRALLRKRTYYLAFAIVFILLAASFRFDSHGIQWMWLDSPFIGGIFLAIGGWFTYLYRHTIKKLKGSNL